MRCEREPVCVKKYVGCGHKYVHECVNRRCVGESMHVCVSVCAWVRTCGTVAKPCAPNNFNYDNIYTTHAKTKSCFTSEFVTVLLLEPNE